ILTRLPACHPSTVHLYVDIRLLSSFPTRRSSDLNAVREPEPWQAESIPQDRRPAGSRRPVQSLTPVGRRRRPMQRWPRKGGAARSEEHTSELQSRFDLVCRLLLENKKTQEHTPEL